MYMDLAERISTLRRVNGLSARQLAALALPRQDRPPAARTGIAAAGAVGVDQDGLVVGSDPAHARP